MLPSAFSQHIEVYVFVVTVVTLFLFTIKLGQGAYRAEREYQAEQIKRNH